RRSLPPALPFAVANSAEQAGGDCQHVVDAVEQGLVMAAIPKGFQVLVGSGKRIHQPFCLIGLLPSLVENKAS
ncbi:MAG: hypothetical protein OXF26_09880, partial [Alphaproteobacteria bacterium]|nr:hypothetical protein [Alphaproteobacteria bacterium]